MTFDEWRELFGNKVIDREGSDYRVIGLITEPAVILENTLGQRKTVVIGSMIESEFKPDRRGGNDRRRREE